jgi:ribonuclease Z
MALMELVLLGTGSPLPSVNRCGGGQLIIAAGETTLVDCGPGIMRRMYELNISPASVGTVFLTHLHSDHITDFADLLVSGWIRGRSRPLVVYGPAGARDTVAGFHAALAADRRYRIAHHGEKLPVEGADCDVHEVEATDDARLIATLGDMHVDAFLVDHRPVVPAFGFRFRRQGKSIVISGDTRRCDALVRAAQGADIFVCEALHHGMLGALIARQRDAGLTAQAAMLTEAIDYHVAPLDVAAMARDAGVKHLVLSHLIPPIPDEGPLVDAFIAGMADVFTGELTVGRDTRRFEC